MFRRIRIGLDRLKFKYRAYKQQRAKKVYLVVCYAEWCVRDFPYAGRMKYCARYEMKCPLVYYYDDHNGTYEEYRITNIFNTTTGWIDSFTFDKDVANKRVKELNASN